MLRKWTAYWLVLFAVIGTLLCWKNVNEQPTKSLAWIGAKSGLEVLIIFLSAFYLPVILIMYTINWLIKLIFGDNHKTLAMAIAVMCTVVFGFLATFALEVLMLTGIYGIGTLSNDFLLFLNIRQNQRPINEQIEQLKVLQQE